MTAKKQNLVFLHGFRGNDVGLYDLAEKYFDHEKFNIYIPNLPPAGGQSLSEYNARFYARFVADYIKKHRIEKPVLIGHSMGSVVAAAVAERYADLIGDKVVFLAPISTRPAKIFSYITPLCILLPDRFFTYVTTKYLYTGKDKDMLRDILARSYFGGKDYRKKFDVFKSSKFSVNYCIDDFYIKKKLLFLAGENDRLMPRKKTTEVAHSFGEKPVFVKDAGHLINYEQPKKAAAIITRFLQD